MSDIFSGEPPAPLRELLRRAPSADERRAQIERYLCDQVALALNMDPALIDARQPLGYLGLDSLTAIELQHRVETDLALSLSIERLLQGATVAQLADDLLVELDQAAPEAAAPTPGRRDPGAQPLSHGQRALWFLQQLAPDGAAYNIAVAARIRADLDVAALRRAFQALADRHAALRTVFPSPQGEPLQQVQDAGSVAFDVADATGWDEALLAERMAEEAQRPFDLTRGPLLRVQLFSAGPRDHALLLTIHHIVADFWSLAVLARELGALYRSEASGAPANLAPLPLTYAEHVQAQAERLAGLEGERLWDYWRGQLAGPGGSGAPPLLNLPTDRPRPHVQTYRGAARSLALGPDLTRRVRELGRVHATSPFATLLAAFQALLYRYSGQSDILVGSPTAGRTSAQLAGLVGYFVNPVALRARIAPGMTFRALLEQTRDATLAALAHQDYPFALLAERIQPERDPSRSPLFQVMFMLQQPPPFAPDALASFALGLGGARMELGGLPVESAALAQRTAQFDLTMTLAEVDGALRAVLQYNADLFDAATISRMLRHFQTLLEGVAARPDMRLADAPLLTAAEQEQFAAWNATATEYPRDACIHELFADQAARTPDAVALICGHAQLSFAALDARANQLAQHLRALGAGPDARIGIMCARSPDLLIGLLGILKAGSAYVPLDPTYPRERLAFMLEDSGARILVTKDERRKTKDEGLGLSEAQKQATNGVARAPEQIVNRKWQIVNLRADWAAIAARPAAPPARLAGSESLAYVIYTSGSTGKPKGVMLPHRNVANFFAGMDQRIGCGPTDLLLGVTSVSFDISILELFWTLTRGARLALAGEQALNRASAAPARARKPLEFSLFYFASADARAPSSADNYRLVFEGAKFADAHGFSAVWTPERHFHAFGGLYPNPSVMSAALAMATQRVRIRAGSVVLPLHNPIRVAEEWSLVDNISRGRVGIAFASGWHSDDFAFFPENYADRKNVMYQSIQTVQRLWRGEAVEVRGGAGNQIAVQILPRPVQPELPIWITAAGAPDTFVRAGAIGANILTHLLGQSFDEVAENIRRYREARAQHGHDPDAGHVTLMLHTFIGDDHDAVRETVRAPFTNYLRSSVGLIENMIRSMSLPLDLKTLSPQDMDDLLAFAFDRYFETSALFGTPESCRATIERVREIGADEIACLIDFGVDIDTVLASLPRLDAVRAHAQAATPAEDDPLPIQAARLRPTLLQCTPSLMRLLLLDPAAPTALRSLRTLLLGGEALPPDLAVQAREAISARIVNMYGPTETTIWSATHALDAGPVAIGHPIANTQIHVLDRALQRTPVGVAGELYIGGDGLARGYLGRPDLTAARFIPNPFAQESGVWGLGSEDERRKTKDESTPSSLVTRHSSLVTRLYRTGDLARFRPDGAIEFLGRVDQQVKLRGYRIELEEIEAALAQHPSVGAGVVAAWADGSGDQRLVAYVVQGSGVRGQGSDDPTSEIRTSDPRSLIPGLREFLAATLPDYMVPAAFITLDALPLTANGKVDRKALPAPEGLQRSVSAEYVAPRNSLEQVIAGIWRQALKLDHVGVHDNFFDLGGHSLLMAQVHSRLREELKRDLPLIKLLEHPTISALSKYLSQERAEQPTFQQSQDRARKQKESRELQRQRAQTRYKPR